jgi:hypothetical protein
MRLPVGLSDAWDALAGSEEPLGLAVTLVFLRQLLDPDAALIAGHDPRGLTSFMPPWSVLCERDERALMLDALAERINQLRGEPLLTAGFLALEPQTTNRAVLGITRWRTKPADNGGALLGELLQRVRPRGGPNGAFYTPYHACYLMATLGGPKPGESVYDSTCGSAGCSSPPCTPAASNTAANPSCTAATSTPTPSRRPSST